jgi:prevent-host-death family protein
MTLTSVEIPEAKTHLAKLLGRVATGERILITNRGQPVAMLVPPDAANRPDVITTVEEMLKARDEQGPTLGKKLTIHQMKEEGRRF